MLDLDYPVIIAKKKIDQPHHLFDRVGLFRLVGIGFRLLIFAVRFVFLKKKERNGSLTLTQSVTLLFLFSPAISVFVRGRGACCVVGVVRD